MLPTFLFRKHSYLLEPPLFSRVVVNIKFEESLIPRVFPYIIYPLNKICVQNSLNKHYFEYLKKKKNLLYVLTELLQLWNIYLDLCSSPNSDSPGFSVLEYH